VERTPLSAAFDVVFDLYLNLEKPGPTANSPPRPENRDGSGARPYFCSGGTYSFGLADPSPKKN
jgi:hypothetical protein